MFSTFSLSCLSSLFGHLFQDVHPSSISGLSLWSSFIMFTLSVLCILQIIPLCDVAQCTLYTSANCVYLCAEHFYICAIYKATYGLLAHYAYFLQLLLYTMPTTTCMVYAHYIAPLNNFIEYEYNVTLDTILGAPVVHILYIGVVYDFGFVYLGYR